MNTYLFSKSTLVHSLSINDRPYKLPLQSLYDILECINDSFQNLKRFILKGEGLGPSPHIV